MWYFSWILGLGLACAFAILNAMWFELHADDEARRRADDPYAHPLEVPGRHPSTSRIAPSDAA